MNIQKKIYAILLAGSLAVSLTGCGGSGTDSGLSTDSAPSANENSGEGEVSWTWGTFRGLYGDAEVTFNEDGGRENIVLKYPNGKVWRQIEYNYESYRGNADAVSAEEKNYLSDRQVYPTTKTTKDAGGNTLYTWNYDWYPCENNVSLWGAGIASDITPILEAGSGETAESSEERYYSGYEWGYDYENEESSGSVNYQELSHLIVGGQYQSAYLYGEGYWLTRRVDGNPAKTWFYSSDGRLDEDLTITWTYEKNKPVSLQLGQYSMDTYLADASDDERTITYTLDESHTNEGEEGEESKDLTQVYAFTLNWNEDGTPSEFRYDSTKEYMNTNEPSVNQYRITYHYSDSVLSGAEYYVNDVNHSENTYTITCGKEGMLETEDHLRSSIGSGDIGAKAYTYYDSGLVESITGYGDFTTADSSLIEYVKTYSEEGWLSKEAYYRNGKPYAEHFYLENGEESGYTAYDENGNITESETY